MKKILAFDLGTGGNKATLYDLDGNRLASAFVAYPTEYPASGRHEQRPRDWFQAIVDSSQKLLSESKIDGADVACIAVSGHSLGCVPLDKNGELLRESTPIWSDSRADREANVFFQSVDPNLWYRTTGNGFPAPHYTIFKLMWLAKNEPETFRKIDKAIGTKDYINYRLTGNISTDYSYASGSGVYDLTAWRYDERLIEASGIDGSILPEIVPSTQIVGNLTPEAAKELGLTTNVVVASGGVDNSCMAVGAGSVKSGRVYASLGSSSWIALCDSKPALDDRTKPYVFTHVVPGAFMSALAIFSSGTTFRWLKDQICQELIARAAAENRDVYDLMTETAARSPIGANGLLMNPSLAGGSSLDVTPKLRGGFVNLDLSHTKADLIRACMEGVSLNMRIVLDGLRELATTNDRMITVGGGSSSSVWQQIYADSLEATVQRTNVGQNAASLGAATIAAIGAGYWDSFDKIDEILQIESEAVPISENVERYRAVLERFKIAARLLAEYALC